MEPQKQRLVDSLEQKVHSTIKNLFEMKYPQLHQVRHATEGDFKTIERGTLGGGLLKATRRVSGGSKERSLSIHTYVSSSRFDAVDGLTSKMRVSFNSFVWSHGTLSFALDLLLDEHISGAVNLEEGFEGIGYKLTEANAHLLGARIFQDMEQCFIPLLFWYDAAFGDPAIPLPGTTKRCNACPEQLTCLTQRGKAT